MIDQSKRKNQELEALKEELRRLENELLNKKIKNEDLQSRVDELREENENKELSLGEVLRQMAIEKRLREEKELLLKQESEPVRLESHPASVKKSLLSSLLKIFKKEGKKDVNDDRRKGDKTLSHSNSISSTISKENSIKELSGHTRQRCNTNLSGVLVNECLFI